ncbi:MAG: CotH kinase family protein [Bacteroidetes bacterium]|nr:CotH kinase family protein [Bacteroidota bacterium]
MRPYLSFLLLFLGKISLLTAQVQLETSNLPIFVITTQNGAEIVDEPKRTAHLGIIWNGDGAVNNITDPFGDYDGQIGIEIRGSSSQWFPKNNFALETQNADSSANNVSVLGFPSENDWVLHGPYSDKTLMRNALAYTMAGWIMDYAPRVRFCEVVINGDYRGVYVFTEKIKQDANRVNISTLTPDENTGDDLSGGYILKFDKFDGLVSDGFPSAYPSIPGGTPGGTVYQYHYPKPDEITPEQKAYIQGYIGNFENVMWSQGFADPLDGYRKYLDVPSLIHFLFIQEIGRNVDGYRLSTFMYKDKDSKDSRLHLGPMWDFNLAFGNVDYCIGPGTVGWALDFNSFCPGDYWGIHFWWNRLWGDPAFRGEMKDEWVNLRATILSNERIFHLVDSLETMLAEPSQRNFVRWPTLNEYVWPNPIVTGSYQGEMNQLRYWLTNRLEWLDGSFQELSDTNFVPPSYKLPLVAPSPFTDEVTFWVKAVGFKPVVVQVFDAQGRLVHEARNYYEKTGIEEIKWDGSDAPRGAYFYKIQVGKDKPMSGKLIKW